MLSDLGKLLQEEPDIAADLVAVEIEKARAEEFVCPKCKEWFRATNIKLHRKVHCLHCGQCIDATTLIDHLRHKKEAEPDEEETKAQTAQNTCVTSLARKVNVGAFRLMSKLSYL